MAKFKVRCVRFLPVVRLWMWSGRLGRNLLCIFLLPNLLFWGLLISPLVISAINLFSVLSTLWLVVGFRLLGFLNSPIPLLNWMTRWGRFLHPGVFGPLWIGALDIFSKFRSYLLSANLLSRVACFIAPIVSSSRRWGKWGRDFVLFRIFRVLCLSVTIILTHITSVK